MVDLSTRGERLPGAGSTVGRRAREGVCANRRRGRAHNPKVAGSNPAPAIPKPRKRRTPKSPAKGLKLSPHARGFGVWAGLYDESAGHQLDINFVLDWGATALLGRRVRPLVNGRRLSPGGGHRTAGRRVTDRGSIIPPWRLS